MNKLDTKDAVEILLSEKKKADVKLEKAYDSYCLFPNEKDQTDWDTYSALSTALDMAISALEKQIPKKPDMVADVYMKNLYNLYCPVCKTKLGNGNSRIGYTDIYNKKGAICDCCGQAIDWEGE